MNKTTLIKITLNGKETEIQAGMTVNDLLTKWKVRPELVTVEVNENILQKLDYETTGIKQGDVVNFVFYMGGGSEKYLTVATGDAEGESSILLKAKHLRKIESRRRQDPSLQQRRKGL